MRENPFHFPVIVLPVVPGDSRRLLLLPGQGSELGDSAE